MIKNLFDNWKTTAAGLVIIIPSIVDLVFGIIEHTADKGLWTRSLLAIVTGIGLLAAGDASKSKKEVAKVDAKVDQTAKAVLEDDTSMLPKPTANKGNPPSEKTGND